MCLLYIMFVFYFRKTKDGKTLWSIKYSRQVFGTVLKFGVTLSRGKFFHK